MAWSKLTVVVCASSSVATWGDSVMTCWPAVTLVEWILSSLVLRAMDVVSSTTSRLAECQQGPLIRADGHVLDGDGALVGEVGKVGLECQVVVDGLDVGGQHLATLGDVDGRVALCAEVLAHISSVGTVPCGDKGRVTGGWWGTRDRARAVGGGKRESRVRCERVQ